MRLGDRPMSRSRLKRRGFPITAYVGANGHGKSAALVHDTIPSLDSGRPVLSTVRFLDFRNPRECPGGDLCDDPKTHFLVRRTATLIDGKVVFGAVRTGGVHQAAHPFYVPLRTFGQLLDWRDGDVCMDEVTGIASSRDYVSLPGPILDLLVQLRRRNIALRWSAPNWARADKVIREVTQSVTVCTATFPKRREQPVDEAPRLWYDRRLFIWKTFDAADYEDWEESQSDNIRPAVTQYIWRPGLLMNRAYDTLDPVTRIGYAVLGTCMTCGGKRSQSKCFCDDSDHDHSASLEVRESEEGRESAAPEALGSLPSPVFPPPL